MNLESVISESSFIPDRRKNELKEYLRSLPDNMEKWFYHSSLYEAILQGDIYSDVPIITYRQESGEHIGGNDAPVQLRSKVMVVTHSCDIEQGKSPFLLVAPVGSADVLERAGMGAGYVTNFKKNLITNLMYMPASPMRTLPESIVYLFKATSVPLKHFRSKKVKKLASLSQNGHYFFLIKLAWHFLRPS